MKKSSLILVVLFLNVHLFAQVVDQYDQWALGKMKVIDAWDYGAGENIKVAILDGGVDVTHPDLQANILASYDATTGNTPIGWHGTPCAGIIGAVRNNNGIAGVAYNAKLLAIRSRENGHNPAWTADAINWAVANGADVISCSWGFSQNGFNANNFELKNAFENAINNGRNGRGCVFVFAIGNNNGTVLPFSATLPSVITVGASTPSDIRWSSDNIANYVGVPYGSNYGDSLDVLAPGTSIRATDIQGIGGYNSSLTSNGGDYTFFDKTSAACPNVAGVVALMLSVNPYLTFSEVRDMIKQTADNTPEPPIEEGAGRVNALEAVKAACDSLSSKMVISGADKLCTSNETYYLKKVPVGYTVSWTVSPANLFTNASGVGATFNTSAASSTAGGTATITATVAKGHCIINKTFTIEVRSSLPTIGGQLASGQLMAFSPVENEVCNRVSQITDMFTANTTSSINWTKISSGFTSWSTAGNDNMRFRFTHVDQTATFRASVTNACGTTSRDFVFKSICCERPRNAYSVSPNPTRANISIQGRIIKDPCDGAPTPFPRKTDFNSEEQRNKIQSIVLVDHLGVVKKSMQFTDDISDLELDVSTLNKGLYFLKVIDGDQIETHRIVVY